MRVVVLSVSRNGFERQSSGAASPRTWPEASPNKTPVKSVMNAAMIVAFFYTPVLASKVKMLQVLQR